MNLKSQIHRISCFPYRHFERSQEIFLALCSFLLLSQKVSPFPLSRIGRYTSMQERSRASLGMTLREYRSLTLPIYFPCNNDTREAPSTFAALLFFMRRTTPLNPKPTTKKPRQEPELFCVRKTYLPNCASMVPAATAVPITPATFGPIACISR